MHNQTKTVTPYVRICYDAGQLQQAGNSLREAATADEELVPRMLVLIQMLQQLHKTTMGKLCTGLAIERMTLAMTMKVIYTENEGAHEHHDASENDEDETMDERMTLFVVATWTRQLRHGFPICALDNFDTFLLISVNAMELIVNLL